MAQNLMVERSLSRPSFNYFFIGIDRKVRDDHRYQLSPPVSAWFSRIIESYLRTEIQSIITAPPLSICLFGRDNGGGWVGRDGARPRVHAPG